MISQDQVLERSHSSCEICLSTDGVTVIALQNKSKGIEEGVALCQTCGSQWQAKEFDPAKWFALKDSVWSAVEVVKVLSIAVLNKISEHSWARDLLDQAYLEEDSQLWVIELLASESENLGGQLRVVDSNGTLLQQGDSVTLIKDLDVKGANFTAKRGTLVKNINLTDDPGFVEGKVNGTQIVLKTQFLKRAT